MFHTFKKIFYSTILLAVFFGALLVYVPFVNAAVLSFSPPTGVFTIGSTFSVEVRVDGEGEAVNAAEGSIMFEPGELKVVNVSKEGSIFSLWTQEPAYSNNEDKIIFAGGRTDGYKGGDGKVIAIQFKALRDSVTTLVFS